MGLKEVQEELKKQLEEMNAIDGEEVEQKQDVEEVKEEVKEEEPPKEEVKEQEEAPKKTNADFARERREKMSREQRLSDELAAANARLAALMAPKEEVKQEDPAPNRDEDPSAHAEWRARQAEKKAEAAVEMAKKAEDRFIQDDRRKQAETLVQQAQAELVGYENQFKESAKDYNDVKNYYVNSLAFSIKRLNPRITNDALSVAVNNQLMLEASQLYNEGYENPIAEIYARNKSDYDSFKSKLPKDTETEEKAPDLSRVAKNRERNAGMAAASGGAGKGELTKRYAATEMTSQEWAKLPKAERERILRQS